MNKLYLFGVFFALYTSQADEKQTPVSKEPIFTFGAIADCQYADKPNAGKREYKLSKEKLKKCVDSFNKMKLDFVINLGDFIEEKKSSFNDLLPITKKLKAKLYHVLGNHDYAVSDKTKKRVPKILKMPSNYYDFKINSWRMIVLDGNDISFHAQKKKSRDYKKASEYYKKNKINSPSWNGAIGKKQLKWLEKKLKKATQDKEKVILFCHFPIWPKDKDHMLWNDKEILTLIEKYPNVKAWINGHNHNGAYAEKNGIHHLTLKGMVDTKKNSFSVIKVYNDQLEIKGFGRQKDQILKLK